MIYSLRRLALLGVFVLFAAPTAGFTAAPQLRQISVVAQPRFSALHLSEAAPSAAPPAEAADADCGCTDDAVGVVTPTTSAQTEGVFMNDVLVTGATLRATELIDASGTRKTIGNTIGEEGKAVVVFLRHLGWPLCWDYALAWQKEAPRLSRAGVSGPLFISVGQPAQLKQFLEVNAPEMNGAAALVDDSADFAGYKAAGFGLMLGDVPLDTPPDFKPPKNMGPMRWLTYLKNVMELSPVTEEFKQTAKFGDVPPGVKVLGGTYAIDGEQVSFSHADPVPGATPDIADVLAAVGA